jgi:hypothetical protein
VRLCSHGSLADPSRIGFFSIVIPEIDLARRRESRFCDSRSRPEDLPVRVSRSLPFADRRRFLSILSHLPAASVAFDQSAAELFICIALADNAAHVSETTISWKTGITLVTRNRFPKSARLPTRRPRHSRDARRCTDTGFTSAPSHFPPHPSLSFPTVSAVRFSALARPDPARLGSRSRRSRDSRLFIARRMTERIDHELHFASATTNSRIGSFLLLARASGRARALRRVSAKIAAAD